VIDYVHIIYNLFANYSLHVGQIDRWFLWYCPEIIELDWNDTG